MVDGFKAVLEGHAKRPGSLLRQPELLEPLDLPGEDLVLGFKV